MRLLDLLVVALASFVLSVAPHAAHAGVPAQQAGEFPEEWFWRNGGAAAAHRAMTGKAPPKLEVKDWKGDDAAIESIVGKDRKGDIWKNLRGKVVVVDFWATWCGPCMNAIPENVELMRDQGEKGLVILGIHDASRGFEKIPATISAKNINYPVAIDVASKSARAWNVRFWPTYAVVDRAGKVRAVGLQPGYVRRVVEKLLQEAPPKPTEEASKDGGGKDADPASKPAATRPSDAPIGPPRAKAPLPRSLLEGNDSRRAALVKFDACPEAPALDGSSQWTPAGSAVGQATSIGDLKGKIVVLDFWATWCSPCIASIPKVNALSKKYADKGVVFVGVCHPQGGDKMVETARAKGIEYTVVLDTKGAAGHSYSVDGYPDYFIIDRAGLVRGADVANDQVEAAIERLLAEDPPAKAAPSSAPASPGA